MPIALPAAQQIKNKHVLMFHLVPHNRPRSYFFTMLGSAFVHRLCWSVRVTYMAVVPCSSDALGLPEAALLFPSTPCGLGWTLPRAVEVLLIAGKLEIHRKHLQSVPLITTLKGYGYSHGSFLLTYKLLLEQINKGIL